MKTTVQTSDIKTAIAFIHRGANRKSTLPILRAIRCLANGKLDLESTDLDVTLRASVPCVSSVDGEAIIPSDTLKNVFSSNVGPVEIEANETGAFFRSATANGQSITFPNADFPVLPAQPEGCRKLTIPAALFFPALKSVALAMSKESTRYVLMGVLIERTPQDGLRMIATDGRRLHIADIPTNEIATHAEGKLSILVPATAIKMIMAMPRDKKAPADVTISTWEASRGDCTTHVAISCGAYTVQAREIAGNFPNYRMVIPDSGEAKRRLALNIDGLAKLIETAAKSCTDKYNSIKLTFDRNTLSISAGSPENKTTVSMPVNYPCSAMDWGCNPKYLLEICKSFEDNAEFTMEFNDELAAVKVIQNNRLAVLMPVRLS
jgi:DNA polymerase III beta subunit